MARSFVFPGVLAAAAAALFVRQRSRIDVVRKQVGRHRSYWQAIARQRPGDDAITYVALGDSAAQGVGVGWAEDGYVGRIAKFLREETGRDVRIINLSISGARLADVLEFQLPHLAEHDPDFVTLAIGGNDVVDGIDPNTFEQTYRAVLEELPAGTIIGDIPRFALPPTAKRSISLARVVGRLVTAREDVTLAEIHRITGERLPWSIFTDFSADLFHPGRRGYQAWAQAFIEAIQRSGTVSRLRHQVRD